MKVLAQLACSAGILLLSCLSLDAQKDAQKNPAGKPPSKSLTEALTAYNDLVELCIAQKKPANPDLVAKVMTRFTAHFKELPEAFFKAGGFYFTLEDYDHAIREYQQGIHADGAHKLDYQKRIVEALARQKKMSEAIDLDREILKDHPDDPEARGFEAGFLLDKGDVDAALSELQLVMQRIPDNHIVSFSLGRAYLAKGEFEKARRQFESVLQTHPDYKPARVALTQLALRTGDYDAALKYAGETLRTDPNDRLSLLLEASALLRKGEPGNARLLLQKLLAENPKDVDALLALGGLNLQQKQYAEAEELFRSAYATDPTNLRGLLGIAEIYFQQNQPEQAVQAIAGEAKKQPDRTDLQRELANAEFRARQFDRAIAGYQSILDRYQDAPLSQADVDSRLAVAWSAVGDYQKAIECMQRAVRIVPSNVGYVTGLAQLFDNAGKQKEAISTYRAALELDPNNGIVLNNVAYLIAQNGGDLDEALAFSQHARQLLPQMNEILDTVGWIYLKKNLTASAIEVFRELNDKIKDNSTFHHHYAMALAQKGDKAAALQELNTALQYHPEKNEEAEIRDLIQKLS